MIPKSEDILDKIERFLQASATYIQALYNEERNCKAYPGKLQRLQYSMDKVNKAWNDFISLNGDAKQSGCNEDIVKPDRYCGKDGKDLLQVFEESLLSDEEYKGF